ncbi:MAG: hypothetical protein IT382_16685 [Deltaproteobacteria bacterium]|nr:hypothetical protein [Deltaproteobacteria bacterium]
MLHKRMKPRSVCPRCEGFMQRKTAISEGVGNRHWGDVDAFLQLGGVDIYHFICISCGNVSAYQVKFEFEGFKKKKRPRPQPSA